ncbi:MAG: hypothetical protein MI867_00335 [Pseudomonadales bacterium]|nr:hypothetical protein [Pseudomonadales bacterium]
MKWFNHNSYFVVVVEKGDLYGAESTYLHSNEEPVIRIFDKISLSDNSHSYPLMSHLSLRDYRIAAQKSSPISLTDGGQISGHEVKDIYDFISSLLVNADKGKVAA